MKQLIVNADDFGYTRGVNRAIVEACHQNGQGGRGIVTATSLMANAPAFDDAVELARQSPWLDVGCHLNLVDGQPVSPAASLPSLVDAGGRLLGSKRLGWRLITRAVSGTEIERECAAQVERLLAAGIQPSHLDTHQHTQLHPTVAAAVARTALRYGIGWLRRPFENVSPPAQFGNGTRRILAAVLRMLAGSFDRAVSDMRATNGLRCPDHFSGFVLTGALTIHSLHATLVRLPEGTTELICHPGYADAALAGSPTILQAERQRELEALCDPAVHDTLREYGIQLVSYRELPVLAHQAAGSSVLGMSSNSANSVGHAKLGRAK
ncbi:MAG: ChbG/HpnK family deacetylase [Acidobacteria bacterium]|nr:ChbG/HpnK family deacetylase [Acidobacteriota bacterium]